MHLTFYLTFRVSYTFRKTRNANLFLNWELITVSVSVVSSCSRWWQHKKSLAKTALVVGVDENRFTSGRPRYMCIDSSCIICEHTAIL